VAWPKGERAIGGMANSDQGMTVIMELMQAVAREYGWRGFEPRIIEAVTLSPAQLAEVVGSYGKGLARVSVDGDSLHITYGAAIVELIPEGSDKFLADNGGDTIPIGFNRGPDGKIASLSALGLTIARDP
jgi:hypothetical protein